MSLKNPSLRVTLYEGPGSEKLTSDERYQTMETLLSKGYAVSRPSTNGSLTPEDGSPLLALGRFEDSTLESLELPAEKAAVRKLETMDWSDESKETTMQSLLDSVNSVRDELQAAQHGAWKPWFPVIDYDRCTNCMQCLSFCLFGVYGVSEEQQIQVQNQDKCKTNCPACSRVCPEVAIMFPKYKAGPINGDVVSQDDVEREKMKIDISALLGGDIYSMLRERSDRAKTRFAAERDSDKALSERQKCLVKLKKQFDIDIPEEALMELPSAEQIQKKAAEMAKLRQN
jgi:Pyruvate/2-oxoacid:ferredoxin oxidoreductase delta subunit